MHRLMTNERGQVQGDPESNIQVAIQQGRITSDQVDKWLRTYQLIEDYVYYLTGSSLQSAQQVELTAGALGIDDATLRGRITGLGELFTARNQVSHELDLQRLERPGDRTRRGRAMGVTTTMCSNGLEVGQPASARSGARARWTHTRRDCDASSAPRRPTPSSSTSGGVGYRLLDG
jgi:hypothetical protein